MTPFLISLALLAALAIQQRAFNAERRDWTKERQLLITKIQHPEFIVSTPESPAIPDAEHLRDEPDEIDLVGKIRNRTGDGD